MKEGKFLMKDISTEDLELAAAYDTKVKDDIEEKKNTTKNTIKLVEEKFGESLKQMGNNPDPVTANVGHYILDTILAKDCLVRKFQVQNVLDTIGCKHSWNYRINFLEGIMPRSK